jgi:hypothetical protein
MKSPIQPITTIHCGNEVAVGLANKTIKPKMSNPATCASIGFKTGYNDASFGFSTFQVFGTWLIFSPSLSRWLGTKLWLLSSNYNIRSIRSTFNT